MVRKHIKKFIMLINLLNNPFKNGSSGFVNKDDAGVVSGVRECEGREIAAEQSQIKNGW